MFLFLFVQSEKRNDFRHCVIKLSSSRTINCNYLFFYSPSQAVLVDFYMDRKQRTNTRDKSRKVWTENWNWNSKSFSIRKMVSEQQLFLSLSSKMKPYFIRQRYDLIENFLWLITAINGIEDGLGSTKTISISTSSLPDIPSKLIMLSYDLFHKTPHRFSNWFHSPTTVASTQHKF